MGCFVAAKVRKIAKLKQKNEPFCFIFAQMTTVPALHRQIA